MEWGEFLRWMSGAGLNAVVGVALSFAADYVPGYNQLEAKYSRLVFMAACFIVPVLATLAAVVTGEFGAWNDWAGTWWPALMAGGMSAFAGTLAHTRSLK